MRRSRLPAVVGGLALTVTLTMALISPAGAAIRPAPRLANPTPTARILVQRYFTLLEHQNQRGLARFLSSGFQIQRADGSGGGKTAYLHDLPTIDSFKNSNFAATEANGVIVARYTSVVTGTANGKPYTPGPAPRLSVFSWNGRIWQLAAHANFNPLTG